MKNAITFGKLNKVFDVEYDISLIDLIDGMTIDDVISELKGWEYLVAKREHQFMVTDDGITLITYREETEDEFERRKKIDEREKEKDKIFKERKKSLKIEKERKEYLRLKAKFETND